MSPENIFELGFNLKETLEYLGFERREVPQSHTSFMGECSSSWISIDWYWNNELLFTENKLTEGLAKYFHFLAYIAKELEKEVHDEQSGL